MKVHTAGMILVDQSNSDSCRLDLLYHQTRENSIFQIAFNLTNIEFNHKRLEDYTVLLTIVNHCGGLWTDDDH